MAAEPKPEAGQVWADNDWRSEGRTIRVDSVDSRFVYVTTLTAVGGATSGLSVGRKSRLLLTRMRPTGTGYRLIKVACPACAGEGRVPTGRFAPTADRECDRCDGDGQVDRAELAEEQP